MSNITYFFIGFFGALWLSSFIKRLIRKSKKNISKDWKIGDLVKVSDNVTTIHDTKILHKLLGWNQDHIFVEEDYVAHKCDWSQIEFNKSAEWRKNYDDCEKFMGSKPYIPRTIKNLEDVIKEIDVPITGPIYYDKEINKLSEIECEILLNKAIEEENFEIAELIKRRLESLKP
jgi:hypothetical protein